MNFKRDTWIKPYLKKYRGLLTLVFFLGLLTFFCSGALMFTSGYLISKSATHPYNLFAVYVPVVLTRAFGIGRPVFKYLERINSHNWVLKVTSNLRKRLYDVLEKGAFYLKEQFKTGDILGLLADDLEHLENLYLRVIFPTVIAYLAGILIVFALGWLNWLFALFMFVAFSIVLFWLPLLSVSVRGAQKERQKQLVHENYVDLTDNTLGLSDWQISGRQQDFVKAGTKQDEKLHESLTKTKHFEWQRDFWIEIVFGIVVIVTLVWTNHQFTSSQVMANWAAGFILAIFPLISAFSPVAQAWEEWPMYEDSVKRLNELKPDTLPTVEQQSLDPKAVSKVAMHDVTFHYDDEHPIDLIKDLSFTVPKGQVLAILGPSGTGKSTLLQLVMGVLAPSQGQVTVNDIDVLALQYEQPKLFSVLEQQPFLFNTTLLNNVRMGNEDATDEQVKTAIAQVGLKDVVEALPEGYDTMVEEDGGRFSGGQRQRIALARILLQNAPIVLLDEPTVGLDPITETDLMTTMFKVLAGKTIIWVTHHLQGFNHVDQVIFLENGAVTMQGSPKELAATNPRYQRLFAMDQGDF